LVVTSIFGDAPRHLPHAAMIGNQERLAAQELRDLEISQERLQVGEELLVVGGRHRGHARLAAEARRQRGRAHDAAEVAPVGEGERHRVGMLGLRRVERESVVHSGDGFPVSVIDPETTRLTRDREVPADESRPEHLRTGPVPQVLQGRLADPTERVELARATRVDPPFGIELDRNPRRYACSVERRIARPDRVPLRAPVRSGHG
jgi:hypothetical protein